MSIKVRLILSYIAMLIIPIVLTVLVSHFASLYYFNALQKGQSDYSYAPIKDALQEREAAFTKIKKLSLQSPEALQQKTYKIQLDKELKGANSGIILRKNNEIVYVTPKLNEFSAEDDLPDFGEYKQDMPFRFKEHDGKVLLSQHDFYFSDGSKGTVFLITNIQPLIKVFRRISIIVAIVVIVMLILTNGLLAYIIARRIVNPLNKLKGSANKIKDGNLDFNIGINSKDEIGELSLAFDEMRKRLKNSLELQLQYENNRKELISNISHDLRTPITAIKGYVEGIRDGVADTPEKMNKYTNTIYTKAVDADKLIEELFLYSKLDLSKQEFSFTEVDIAKYLRDFIEELQFELEKRNMLITYSSKVGSRINVRVDVQQLKRVIVNIIENSVKYMDKEQGKIQVFLEDKDQDILIVFKDNGQGIDKKALPYIFDRFYRADPSRNSSTGGSGLGLSIAKKIIEEHGGTMWCESIEGQGTTIFFTLKKVRSGGVI